MSKKYELYLTECSPNGTNDLIIVSRESDEIEHCISECTFGYTNHTPDATLFDGRINDPDAYHYPEFAGNLYRVSIGNVLSRIAISPVSDGSLIIKQLKHFNLI